MPRHIALLRGVNVGGVTIKSVDLATVFRDLGFTSVKTVLASGNVAFDSEAPAGELKASIERALAERFGYEAWIVLLSQASLGEIAAAYPFERDDDRAHPYVLFGSDQAVLEELWQSMPDTDETVESIARGDGVIFWRVLRGSSTDTPMAKHAARAKYKSTTTNRNLRTVEKLLGA